MRFSLSDKYGNKAAESDEGYDTYYGPYNYADRLHSRLKVRKRFVYCCEIYRTGADEIVLEAFCGGRGSEAGALTVKYCDKSFPSVDQHTDSLDFKITAMESEQGKVTGRGTRVGKTKASLSTAVSTRSQLLVLEISHT